MQKQKHNMRCKIFAEYRSAKLEQAINNWLIEGNDDLNCRSIHSILYQIDGTRHHALIIYEDWIIS
jgi:hypothetical protein